jgi:hypothetical protein
MNTLKSLIIDQFTDKDHGHSYCELYDILFKPAKSSASNVMEIGVDKGGSILLWSQYFTNSNCNIYGLDCLTRQCIHPFVLEGINKDSRVRIIDSVDAYLPVTASYFKVDNAKFDVIIDDGPHTYVSNKICIQQYSELLSETGILVIEDIQDYLYVYSLYEHVPEELKKYVEVYDLRDCINQYDDILFVINKSGVVPTEIYGGTLTRTTESIGVLTMVYKWQAKEKL